MANKIKCTCGHSWNKSDSSKKDATVCHICGKDNTMKNGGWLDKYGPGGQTTDGCPANYYKNAQGQCVPEYMNFKMPINRTDVIGRTPVQIIKNNQQGEKIHAQNVATDKRQFVGQGKASTKESEARRKTLTKQSVTGLPNVKYDEQTGTTSAVNPNMTYEGQPDNFMGERQQKGYEHVMGALEAAGYITGAGELASIGYNAVKKALAEKALAKMSKVSNSIMRNAEGQIQFLDNATYRDAVVTGKKNVINYLSDPRYASVVEQNQQLANRLGLNQRLPIQREMAIPSLYEARLAKINEPLSLNDPRVLETDIINNNSNVGAQYARTLDGKGSLTIPRVHSPSEITRNTSHEVLHHIYPNLGEGYPSFTPLEARKAKSVFKGNAALRKIEEQNNVPFWYLDDVDELVPNSFDLASDLDISKFQKYPGKESFKNMLDSYSGGKKFIRDALKLDSKRDYKRAWDMLSGVRLGVVPAAIGIGAASQIEKKKNGGWLSKYGKEANANEGYSSAPKGWIGEGYSTEGRNYSPAWGGQFQKGGYVQPTSTDSLNLYNAQMALNKFYENEMRAGRIKKTGEYYNSDIKPINQLTQENLDFYRDAIKTRKEYANMFGDRDPDSGGYYDDAYKKYFNLTHSQIKALEYKGLDKTKSGNQYQAYYRDVIIPMQNMASPFAIVDSRIKPQRRINYSPSGSKYPGGEVRVYDYDILAIKPRIIRNIEEQKEWEKRYGKPTPPTKTQTKKSNPPKVKDKPKPPSEPTLKPKPFVPATKIPMGQPSKGMQIQERKFPKLDIPNVEMSGPYMVGYTDYDTQQGVDRGFATAEERDAFVKQLSERNANANVNLNSSISSYYDVKKKKKQNGGQFAMGGNVYPVNYIPQAQKGLKKKKKKTLIFAESSPYIIRQGNPFTIEGNEVKQYLKNLSPDEEVQVYDIYNDEEKMRELLANSDENTRLAFFAHHGSNLFGSPAENLGQMLQNTTYANCYLGSCYSGDIADKPQFRNLQNFHFRPGYSHPSYDGLTEPGRTWQGFNPKTKTNAVGENAVNEAMFNTTTDPMYFKIEKDINNLYDQKSTLYKKYHQNNRKRSSEIEKDPNYIKQLATLDKLIIDSQLKLDKLRTIVRTPVKGVDYDILNPISRAHKASGVKYITKNEKEKERREKELAQTAADQNTKVTDFLRGKFEDGGEIPKAQNGWLEKLTSTLNPKNWGVKDYSNNSSFDKAYSNARKGIPSEGPYAKKTMPSAQEGKIVPVDPKTNPTYSGPIAKSVQFMNDWMNSPKYKEMLANSISGRDYKTIDKNRKSLIQDENINYYEEQAEPRTAAESQYMGKGKSNMYFNTDSNYDYWNDAIIHELSHITDAGGIVIPSADKKLMNKYATHNIKNSPIYDRAKETNTLDELKDFTEYINEPTETRARINNLRSSMRDQKVYDPFTESFSKDMFDKYKQLEINEKDKKEGRSIGMDPYQQLKMTYTDEEIEDMMNKVSKNEDSNASTFAQNGQKISYNEWKKENNLKETPDYNLKRAWELGYVPDETGHLPTVDNQTGQFLKAKGHPTIQKELDWYNSPEGAEFKSKNTLDSTGNFFKYVPKGQNGQEMKYYQNGLDWKPKGMKNGGKSSDTNYKFGKSKIQGVGTFAKNTIQPGDYIGKVHTINELGRDYDFTSLGNNHNHSDNPNVQNVLIGNERHLVAIKPIAKGQELTSNYRLQSDLEQPEGFGKKNNKKKNGGWLNQYK